MAGGSGSQHSRGNEGNASDSYRFDDAMHEGVQALISAFGKHGFRFDEFFDKDEFAAELATTLEPELRKAFPDPDQGESLQP